MKRKEMFVTHHNSGRFVPTLIGALVMLCWGQAASATNVTNLRCEHLKDPLGIDTVEPRLSWVFASELRGQSLSPYQILVASSKRKLEKGQETQKERRKAELLQAWHQRRQEPYDPIAAAQLALRGFMQSAPDRLLGPDGYRRVCFDSKLLPEPKRAHGQWDCGDCTARALLAWTALREMTGDRESGREVEQAQEKYLLSLLHPETGLIFAPDRSEAAEGRYYYHMWDQSRTLRALVRWYATKPANHTHLRPLIKRMIVGLDRLATIRGTDDAWGAYAAFTHDSYRNDQPVDEGQWIFVRGGLCVEPLVDWAEITGDVKALDLARLFANGALRGPGRVPDSPAEIPHFRTEGSFRGHLHSRTSTLIGVAKLGRYCLRNGERETGSRYLHAARKSYDWLFSPACGANRMGWVPECPHTAHSETCCAADAMELAAVLASCADMTPGFADWIDLYDDLERMAVNVPAVTQIRFTPEWEAYLEASYREEAPESMEIARKFNGTWSATFFPNDLTRGKDLILGGCCQYSGTTTLYTGWRNAMQWSGHVLQVNYFLNRCLSQAEMTTGLPAQGKVRISLKEQAAVKVRVPGWLQPADLTLERNSHPIDKEMDDTGRFVVLDECPAGTILDITFPLEERTTTEAMGGKEFTAKWRGNYVMEMTPREGVLPLFP